LRQHGRAPLNIVVSRQLLPRLRSTITSCRSETIYSGFGVRSAITACAEALRKPNTSGPNTEAPWVRNLREMLALEFFPAARDTRTSALV
jgi:hypothetical protein